MTSVMFDKSQFIFNFGIWNIKKLEISFEKLIIFFEFLNLLNTLKKLLG